MMTVGHDVNVFYLGIYSRPVSYWMKGTTEEQSMLAAHFFRWSRAGVSGTSSRMSQDQALSEIV